MSAPRKEDTSSIRLTDISVFDVEREELVDVLGGLAELALAVARGRPVARAA